MGVSIAAFYALKSIRQGRSLLQEISKTHNELTESVIKIDGKAQEAILRLDSLAARGKQ